VVTKVPAPGDGSPPLHESQEITGIFARNVRDYASRRESGPVALLEAGCGRPACDLGVGRLRAAGLDIRVTGVDHDHPLTRAVSAARGDLHSFTLGDLRTVPLPPRSFDIVHCAGLLERIHHVELVLDRFVAALKPGGLLLLRIADRDCAAGVVDRFVAALPRRARERAWRRLRPNEPGPYPAVYEPIVCGPGIQGYAMMRGLVIAERQALRRPRGGAGLPARAFATACRVTAGASRGRYTDAHDELLFVARRPEDRFARVLAVPDPPDNPPM
jgi:Methyltransferase domain